MFSPADALEYSATRQKGSLFLSMQGSSNKRFNYDGHEVHKGGKDLIFLGVSLCV
jgi:hypothetical protein